MAVDLPPERHQIIWGQVELDCSSGNTSGDHTSTDNDSLKKKRMDDRLKNVTFMSSESPSQSEHSRTHSTGKEGSTTKLENGGLPSSAKDAKDGEDEDANYARSPEAHEKGECRPCHYVNSKFGCTNGDNCSFCHLDHQKRSRPRPCKAKRTQCKRIAGLLDTVFAHDPDQFTEAMELLSMQSGYMRTVMKSKMRHQNGPGDVPDRELPPAPPPQPVDEAKLVAIKKALGSGSNKVSL